MHSWEDWGRGALAALDPGVRPEGQLREVAEATHGFGNLKPALTSSLRAQIWLNWPERVLEQSSGCELDGDWARVLYSLYPAMCPLEINK